MKRIHLIHLNQDDAKQCVERLEGAGYDVAYSPDVGATIRDLKTKPPDAVVIALDRTPSAGRDIALTIRKHGATRHVPLVFTGGAPEKVERVKQVLPDAAACARDGPSFGTGGLQDLLDRRHVVGAAVHAEEGEVVGI